MVENAMEMKEVVASAGGYSRHSARSSLPPHQFSSSAGDFILSKNPLVTFALAAFKLFCSVVIMFLLAFAGH